MGEIAAEDRHRLYSCYYFLDENNVPQKCQNEDDYIRAWSDNPRREVAQTDIGDVHVSTVFLALDHNHGSSPPLLYETMIFGGKHDQDQERYTTREDALSGHDACVTRVRESLFGADWLDAYKREKPRG